MRGLMVFRGTWDLRWHLYRSWYVHRRTATPNSNRRRLVALLSTVIVGRMRTRIRTEPPRENAEPGQLLLPPEQRAPVTLTRTLGLRRRRARRNASAGKDGCHQRRAPTGDGSVTSEAVELYAAQRLARAAASRIDPGDTPVRRW
jgi:hypothetical protein